MARRFGTSTVAGSVSGVVLNTASTQKKPDIAEARDENGKVTDRKAYSLTETLSVQGLVDGDNAPQGGEVVAISGRDFMVEDSTVSGKNTDYVQYSGTLVNKDDAECAAYVS